MRALLNELATADGAGVRVAIVDTGVEVDHPWVGGKLVASFGVSTEEENAPRIVPVEPGDVRGHGTAAAGQVRRFAPNAELISVRILGQTLRANSQALIAALRWLLDQNVHVVNLSLSTMREQLALRIGQAVDDLYAGNVSCVCARGYHMSGRAYPTCFAGSIGVSYREAVMGRLVYRPGDLVEFEAAGVGLEVAWCDHQTRVVNGSSYACPLVTGLVARILSIEPNLAPFEVTTALKAFALRQADGWWEPWMDGVEHTPAAGG